MSAFGLNPSFQGFAKAVFLFPQMFQEALFLMTKRVCTRKQLRLDVSV